MFTAIIGQSSLKILLEVALLINSFDTIKTAIHFLEVDFRSGFSHYGTYIQQI